jgi:hypothetical protein
MSVPMRKDESELEEDLTTADLAQGKRPMSEDRLRDLPPEDQPKPVLTGRSSGQIAQRNVPTISSDVRNTDVRNTEASNTTDAAPLFPNNELEDLRNRWSSVQTTFVDEPRSAVEQADGLVAAAMKRLAEVFAEERSRLEQQWDRGDNVSTEDLRIALQRYRSFFQRLLSV